jgi:hypothetical protein
MSLSPLRFFLDILSPDHFRKASQTATFRSRTLVSKAFVESGLVAHHSRAPFPFASMNALGRRPWLLGAKIRERQIYTGIGCAYIVCCLCYANRGLGRFVH